MENPEKPGLYDNAKLSKKEKEWIERHAGKDDSLEDDLANASLDSQVKRIVHDAQGEEVMEHVAEELAEAKRLYEQYEEKLHTLRDEFVDLYDEVKYGSYTKEYLEENIDPKIAKLHEALDTAQEEYKEAKKRYYSLKERYQGDGAEQN